MTSRRLRNKPGPGECAVVNCSKVATNVDGEGHWLCPDHHAAMMKTTPVHVAGTSAEDKALAVAKPAEIDATQMLEQLKQVVIVDGESLELAGELLREVKVRLKTLDEHRTSITKPILAAKSKVDSLFKPGIKALQACEDLLKNKVQAFMREQEQRVMEQLRQAASEPTVEGQALAVVEPLAQLPVGMTERRVWTFEVQQEELIPRNFMCLDTEKVKGLIKALGGENVVIPGIRVYQEKQLAVRTGDGDAD